MKNWMHSALAGVLLLGTGQGSGQNLVPNGSFEDYIDCPQTVGGWPEVVGWDSPYTTSADYFNECAAPGPAGVPANHLGYQPAADGQAYMGVGSCDPNTIYQELLHAQLSQPLQVGVPVALCFKVAVGGFGLTPTNSVIYTCKNIGIKFFVDPPITPQEWDNYLVAPPNTAALHLDVLPTDTAIWYHVSGTYTPDSAYTDIVIGNFFDTSYCQISVLDSTGYGMAPLAYSFVDDVVVSYDATLCEDPEGIEDPNHTWPQFYPNPFSGSVTVELASGAAACTVQIFDAAGRQVFSEQLPNGSDILHLSLGDLAAGSYSASMTYCDGTRYVTKLIRQTP